MSESTEERMQSLQATITRVQDEQSLQTNQLAAVQTQLDSAQSVTEEKLDLLSSAVNTILRKFESLNVDTEQGTAGAGASGDQPRRYPVISPTGTDQRRVEGTVANIHGANVTSTTSYTVSEKLKIWQRTMGLNVVKTKGDPNFPAAKDDFMRMHRKFPLSDDVERELLMLSFQGTALKIANTVNRENPTTDSTGLWVKLTERLYNDSQRKSRNTAFLRMAWNEKKETIEQFAERLQLLASALGIGNDLVQATFIRGLPQRLQPYAYGAWGTFDDVVSTVSNVANSLSLGQHRKDEQVRQLSETSTVGQRESAKLQEDEPHERLGVKRVKLCYRCGKPGHFAADTRCPEHPTKRRGNDDKTVGEVKGDGSGNAVRGVTFDN